MLTSQFKIIFRFSADFNSLVQFRTNKMYKHFISAAQKKRSGPDLTKHDKPTGWRHGRSAKTDSWWLRPHPDCLYGYKRYTKREARAKGCSPKHRNQGRVRTISMWVHTNIRTFHLPVLSVLFCRQKLFFLYTNDMTPTKSHINKAARNILSPSSFFSTDSHTAMHAM